jgi:hypothetical protein
LYLRHLCNKIVRTPIFRILRFSRFQLYLHK